MAQEWPHLPEGSEDERVMVELSEVLTGIRLRRDRGMVTGKLWTVVASGRWAVVPSPY